MVRAAASVDADPVVAPAEEVRPLELLRDALESSGVSDSAALWSDEILVETSRNIVDDLSDLTAEHLEKTFDAMRRAFLEAAVRGYEHLIDSMPNHPRDRHVLAATVAGGAEVLVTSNLRHFPSGACQPLGIRVQSPDDFLVEMIELGPGLMVDVLRRQAARKTRPPLTLDEMLERLTVHTPSFAAAVRAIRQD